MYAKCGELEVAREVFDGMHVRDSVSWNAMISGYASRGLRKEALELFDRMRAEGAEANCITWNTVANIRLKMGQPREALRLISQMSWNGLALDLATMVVGLNACSQIRSVKLGKEIHGVVIRSHCDGSETVTNTLIVMYSRCNDNAELAHLLFQRTRVRSLITWNAMLAGFAIHDKAEEASIVFRDLVWSGNEPNYVTIVTLSSLCARVANLQHGRELHSFITKRGFEDYLLIWNSLVDMYSKAGKISVAQAVFDTMTDRDQVSYTSLISGYGVQGEGMKAVQLFNDMISSNIQPDVIAMVAVLTACSHSGLVKEGQDLFDKMSTTYGINPRMEHYSCLVDLYARAGLLEEAEDILRKMPTRPSAAIWAALLNACSVHRNTEVGERVANKLLEMKTENAGHYVLIANMYAAAGLWKELAEVRMVMRDRGVRKAPGVAWVDIGKGFRPFSVGDRSSPLAPEIYTALEGLIEQMRDVGHVDNVLGFEEEFGCVQSPENQNFELYHEEIGVAV
ncbi:uncharacterized protein A4U43_C03F21540 [Asparagus officinalis]|uniref:Pentatricopeptide repeat-containing protein n=2 Tax=Asparagus officinalis TaxID=4686 RepID=A0A5P1FG78_ASPOF|nr:uncharacterized protein A4U43_C03F21540 [Asparagus officinalis]